jgi:hypothetical protein
MAVRCKYYRNHTLNNLDAMGSCASTDGRPHRVVVCLTSLGLPKHGEGISQGRTHSFQHHTTRKSPCRYPSALPVGTHIRRWARAVLWSGFQPERVENRRVWTLHSNLSRTSRRERLGPTTAKFQPQITHSLFFDGGLQRLQRPTASTVRPRMGMLRGRKRLKGGSLGLQVGETSI